MTTSVERAPGTAPEEPQLDRRQLATRRGAGALIGLLAAAIALGVGELVASFVRPAAAPVIAVGNRFIVLTPESVKRWATGNLGTSDKTFLLAGIYLVTALFAIVVGVLALRRLVYGLVGIGLFGVLGVYSAMTANASKANDVTPTIIATLVALGVLTLLVRLAGPDDPARTRLFADRRRFLQGAAATAAFAALAGLVGRRAQHARFDVADDRAKVTLPPVTDPKPAEAAVPAGVDLGKSGVPWATPSKKFYRIDTALSVPQIPTASWELKLHGMVDNEMTITWADLLERPMVERWITLCCVSNEVGGGLIGNALFRGALLADLLREAGIQSGSDQLLMKSQDGMTIGAPTKVVMDGRQSLLAIGMNGQPLPVEHGFPVRVVVPGLYGYVSACKWVVDILVTTYKDATAYWPGGGWAAKPPIRLASRIDTPRTQKTVAVGEPVAIAGVAWDQHVGVSRVEVQVDDGPWAPARLATVPSTDTWRQWVYPWTPQQSGTHRLRVRAVDAAGRVQDAKVRAPYPSGSSGYHAVTVRAIV